MEKMNCDIIRDLIPSYVDEVCSQATKACVESHLEECGECRLIAARLRTSALSGEKLEQKGLDGLKKIKRNLNFQRVVNYGILLFLLYYGIELFLAQNANYVMFSRPWVLETICILVVLVSCTGRRERQSPGKKAYLLGGFSIVLDVYFFLIYLYLTMQLRSGVETIFGIELMKVGPILRWQLAAAFAAQLAFFLYNLWCTVRQERNCHLLLCLNITGIFLAINYDLWLYFMASFDTLKLSYLYMTLESIIPGAIGITGCLLISRRQKR